MTRTRIIVKSRLFFSLGSFLMILPTPDTNNVKSNTKQVAMAANKGKTFGKSTKQSNPWQEGKLFVHKYKTTVKIMPIIPSVIKILVNLRSINLLSLIVLSLTKNINLS